MKQISLLTVLTFILFSNCTRTPSDPRPLHSRPIQIVTTVGMITDITRRIAGERAVVTGLMDPGVDPHLFRASARDVSAMTHADIVFYGGLHLEGKMVDILEETTRIKTVAVSRDIPHELLLDDGSGQHDPHLWFDVTLWMYAVRTIRDSLIQLDPQHKSIYQANARAYLQELEELHRYVLKRSAELEPSQRVLITAHDAFGYFGRQYGFEVLGLQGISTVSEARVSDYQSLADLIAQRRVKAVFIETSVPVKSIQALKEAVASRGYTVAIGGELFSDSMGDQGSPEDSYIGMVRHNIDTIIDALK